MSGFVVGPRHENLVGRVARATRSAADAVVHDWAREVEATKRANTDLHGRRGLYNRRWRCLYRWREHR